VDGGDRFPGASTANDREVPLNRSIRISSLVIWPIKINILMADPQLRQKFGKAGRQRAIDKFSWHAIAAQTKSLYEELVGAAKVVSGRLDCGLRISYSEIRIPRSAIRSMFVDQIRIQAKAGNGGGRLREFPP